MKPLKKVRNEIERKEAQLALLQGELETLRNQELQLENAEMVAAIRSAKFSADDMLALVQVLKKGGTDLSDLLPLVELEPNLNESEAANHETI